MGKSALHPNGGGDPTYCDQERGNGNVQAMVSLRTPQLDTSNYYIGSKLTFYPAKAMYNLLDSLGCGAGGISKDGDATALGNMKGGCDQVYQTLEPTISPAPTLSEMPTGLPSYPPTNYPTVTHRPR